MTGTSRRRSLFVALLVSILMLLTYPGQAAVVANWPGYLFDVGHSSYNAAATTITPANVSTLTKYWTWKPAAATMSGQPAPVLYSSPTVYAGRVYIGTGSGDFYALDLATKTVVWKKFIAFVTAKTCGAQGFVSTATVAPDASRGGQLTVYVAAADGYVYALNAATGATVWRGLVAQPSATSSNYYNWGSPTVSNGAVYEGISSQCDKPLVRAGVKGFSQASGAPIGTYFSVPAGSKGGSVWSSIATNAGGNVFASTGNGPNGTDGESVVRLSGTTLARQDGWRVPSSQATPDADFGASPTLFSATLNGVSVPMVGACNKNGRYYALRQQNLSAGPVWQFQAAVATAAGQSACLTAAIWDGQRLFLAATSTTIGGTKFPGSIRQLNPATGAVIWERGLGSGVLGSPTLDGSGVIAAGTYNLSGPNSVYLINSTTGALIRTIGVGANPVYGQPVFADGYLLVPTVGAATGLIVFRP
ncbi:MAG: outer membrane protein assembly factor BamB family protein [Blastococcus sp.]